MTAEFAPLRHEHGATQKFLTHTFRVSERGAYWIPFEVDGVTGAVTTVDTTSPLRAPTLRTLRASADAVEGGGRQPACPGAARRRRGGEEEEGRAPHRLSERHRRGVLGGKSAARRGSSSFDHSTRLLIDLPRIAQPAGGSSGCPSGGPCWQHRAPGTDEGEMAEAVRSTSSSNGRRMSPRARCG